MTGLERKETWLITMEAAITIFVAAELILSVLSFVCAFMIELVQDGSPRIR
jgi:hypothetical protein